MFDYVHQYLFISFIMNSCIKQSESQHWLMQLASNFVVQCRHVFNVTIFSRVYKFACQGGVCVGVHF